MKKEVCRNLLATLHRIDRDRIIPHTSDSRTAQIVASMTFAGDFQRMAIPFQQCALACISIIQIERLSQLVHPFDRHGHISLAAIVNTYRNIIDTPQSIHLCGAVAGNRIGYRSIQFGVKKDASIFRRVISIFSLVGSV